MVVVLIGAVFMLVKIHSTYLIPYLKNLKEVEVVKAVFRLASLETSYVINLRCGHLMIKFGSKFFLFSNMM